MKNKPKITKWHLIETIYRIFSQEKCPRCRCIAPYYNDCPICEGYVIGCDLAEKPDILMKYIAWLKQE